MGTTSGENVAAASVAITSLHDLRTFEFNTVLNEDPLTHSLTLLGTLKGQQAIIRVEKTALKASDAANFFSHDGLVQKIQLEQNTDIYTWLFAWLGDVRDRDLKINVVCPATETHVRKATRQEQVMVRETPELYQSAVKPYIDAFPPSRTKWVEEILTGRSEADKVLHSGADFMILPDMKWDLTTVAALYLVAIAQDRSIRSLRDLRGSHLPLLKAIRDESERIVKKKWNLTGKGSLRMYIHYQPSYYHFHVHIVNANYQGGVLGMTVGQAHLLDDMISLLEIDANVFEKMTFSYSLGDQHELLRRIQSTSQ